MAEKCLIDCPDSVDLNALSRQNNSIGDSVPNLGGGYIAPFNSNMPRPLVPGPGLGQQYYPWGNSYLPEGACVTFRDGRTYDFGGVEITKFTTTRVCPSGNYNYDGPFDPGLPFFGGPGRGHGGRW